MNGTAPTMAACRACPTFSLHWQYDFYYCLLFGNYSITLVLEVCTCNAMYGLLQISTLNLNHSKNRTHLPIALNLPKEWQVLTQPYNNCTNTFFSIYSCFSVSYIETDARCDFLFLVPYITLSTNTIFCKSHCSQKSETVAFLPTDYMVHANLITNNFDMHKNYASLHLKVA